MNKELDDKLVKTFPLLYRNRYAKETNTCMCWGFTHGDGWHSIIWDLSLKVEPLITAYTLEHPDDKDPPCAGQVKEKFGTLRFYMDGKSVPGINEAINKAESLSAVTCEVCGQPGKIRTGGWISCLCDEHANGKQPISSDPEEGYVDDAIQN